MNLEVQVVLENSDSLLFKDISSFAQLKLSITSYFQVPVRSLTLKFQGNNSFLTISDESTFTFIANNTTPNIPLLLYAEVEFQQERFLTYYIFNKFQNHSTIPLADQEMTLKEASDKIINQENFSASKVCAMYSSEGNPLVGSLCLMYTTLVKTVCDDMVCIFIIDYCDSKVPAKINPNIGKNSIRVKGEGVEFNVKADLINDTVLILKQKIFAVRNILPHLLKLDSDQQYLSMDSTHLDSYGIEDGSLIKYTVKTMDFSEATYKTNIVQSTPQTRKGIRIFHHFLYSLRKNPFANYNKVSAAIRYASGNCSPLLHSLYEVKLNKSISLLDAIALEEGFLILINNVLNTIFKMNIGKKKLLEYTLEVVGVILEIGENKKFQLQAEEKFETIGSHCGISHEELTEPVRLPTTYGFVLCNLKSVLKALTDGEIIPEVLDFSKDLCKIDPFYSLIIARNFSEKKANITRWTGSFNLEISVGFLFSSSLPANISWASACKLKEKFPCVRLVKAGQLKDCLNCLTLNKKKEIVINKGLGMKCPNKVNLLNVMDGQSNEVDINELALITDNSIEGIAEIPMNLITKIPEELLVIVFDTSSSMQFDFFNEGDDSGNHYSRLYIAQQLFNAFADRVIGFHVNVAVCVVIFNQEIQLGCEFTENILNFVNVIENCKLKTGSRLWDATDYAIQILQYMKKNTYPMAKQRILCLTDGRDHNSQKKKLEIIQSLQTNDIILDAVVIGKISLTLKAFCFATGGCVFIPKTIEKALRIFESETFLNVNLRADRRTFKISTEQDISMLQNYEEYTNPPQILIPAQVYSEVITLAKAFIDHSSSSAGYQSSPQLYSRLLNELHYIQVNPHNAISVFPCKDDITFWNVIMNGPDSSPYSSGVFLLYIRFLETYPTTAPQVRFVTPIYHCNINMTGRICHSILDQFYSTDTRIKRILDCVYGLFLSPEPNDPLDISVAMIFNTEKEKYENTAKEWTYKHANRPAEVLLRGIEIQVSIKPEFIDAYTGNIMEDPVFIENLGCNLDRTTANYILSRPDEFPGISIYRDSLVTNAELKNEIQRYLLAVGK